MISPPHISVKGLCGKSACALMFNSSRRRSRLVIVGSAEPARGGRLRAVTVEWPYIISISQRVNHFTPFGTFGRSVKTNRPK